MTNEYNPDGKEIRFIDSHYKDLFHIPDGSCVQIHYPDEMVVKPCTFIDEYHTQIGYNVFHICQFAEIMERNGASYMPEPEIMGDEAAWKVGKDRILAVQTCEDGYDYTLLDENYNEIDGGQVDNPELSMLEVRRDILESFGLERRELRAMFYEDVMEQAFEVGRQAVVVNDPIAELAFKLDRFAENFDPYEYRTGVVSVQRGRSCRSIFVLGQQILQRGVLLCPISLIRVKGICQTAPADIVRQNFLLFGSSVAVLVLQLEQGLDGFHISCKFLFRSTFTDVVICDVEVHRRNGWNFSGRNGLLNLSDDVDDLRILPAVHLGIVPNDGVLTVPAMNEVKTAR